MRHGFRFLPLVVLCLSQGCAGMRQRVAEEGYLQQQMYDYSYDVPLDPLWAAAKEMLGVSGGADGRDGDVRTFATAGRPAGSEVPAAPGLLLRGWEAGGRGYLRIYRVEPGGPAPHGSDLASRAADLEVKLLERFDPEEARKLQDGARQAGLRAR